MGIIEDSNKKAFIATAEGIIDAAENNYSRKILTTITPDNMYYEYSDGIESSSTGSPALEYKGKKPNSGNVYINKDGDISISIHNGKWCATKAFKDNKVSISNTSHENCIIVLHPTCVVNNDYVFNENTKTITKYNGSITNIVIPESFSVNGTCYDVEHIGDSAFRDTTKTVILTKVSIPDTVKTIGDSAFRENSITEVKMPFSLESIGSSAFSKNVIEILEFFGNLKSIGSGAFELNIISSLSLPEGLINIDGGAFYNNLLTDIVLPNTLQNIESAAFANNRLTKIIIPDSVKTMGYATFSDNLLEEVIIGNGVTSINSQFSGNGIKKLTIGTGVTSIGMDFQNMDTTELYIPKNVVTISSSSFSNLKADRVTIDAQNIDMSSFYGSDIGTLIFNDNLKSLSGFTVSTINNVIIDSKDASASMMFMNSTIGNMKALIKTAGSPLINSLTIENFELSGSGNNLELSSGSLSGNITNFSIKNATINGSFNGNINSLSLDNVIFASYASSIFSDRNIVSLSLKNINSEIPQNTFSNNKITTLIIPTGVTSIGIEAFKNNELTDIFLPNTVTSIGHQAFYGNYLTKEKTIIDNYKSNITLGQEIFHNNGSNKQTIIEPTYKE